MNGKWSLYVLHIIQCAQRLMRQGDTKAMVYATANASAGFHDNWSLSLVFDGQSFLIAIMDHGSTCWETMTK